MVVEVGDRWSLLNVGEVAAIPAVYRGRLSGARYIGYSYIDWNSRTIRFSAKYTTMHWFYCIIFNCLGIFSLHNVKSRSKLMLRQHLHVMRPTIIPVDNGQRRWILKPISLLFLLIGVKFRGARWSRLDATSSKVIDRAMNRDRSNRVNYCNYDHQAGWFRCSYLPITVIQWCQYVVITNNYILISGAINLHGWHAVHQGRWPGA